MEYEVAIGEAFDVEMALFKNQLPSQSFSKGPDSQTIRMCITQVDAQSVMVECNHPITTRQRLRARDPQQLTTREMDVAQWLVVGKSNPEIAQLLGISRWTAKLHVSSIMRKVNVVSRTQVPLALMNKSLIPPSGQLSKVGMHR